jgi:hypothetical protein
VPEYYDLDMVFRQAAIYLIEITWTSDQNTTSQHIKLYVVPKVYDLQLRDKESARTIDGKVGDFIRVTLDENPTTGYVTLNNAAKESKSTSVKSIEPTVHGIVEANGYFARYVDMKTRYLGGITGFGGCRVMTFALT